MTGLSLLYRGMVLVVVVSLIVIPAAGDHTGNHTDTAQTGEMKWEIVDLSVVPSVSQDGTGAAIMAHVVDRNGDPVTPDRCETINVIYDYGGETDIRMEHVDNRMEQSGVPRSWFYDAFDVSDGDGNVTVWARGRCDGIQPDTWERENISFVTGGNLNVDILSNINEAYWEDERMDHEWNVTWDAPGAKEFVPYPNMSYTLYRPDMSVADSGDLIPVGTSFPAAVHIPRGSGLYVLNVEAHNESLSQTLGISNPYGGVAKPIRVRPTYIEGDSTLDPSEKRCNTGVTVVCEKGASMELGFREKRASADQVNVSVQPVSGTGVYKEIPLERQNDSYWTGSFQIPEDFDTSRFTHSLQLEYEAIRRFERNGVQEVDTVTEQQFVDIEKFEVLGSNPPFIRLGETIGLGFIPISPITEEPRQYELFSRIQVNITNPEGETVHRDVIDRPGQIYDGAQNLFVYDFEVPYNTTTGLHTANIRVEDNFSTSGHVQSQFKVIGVNGTSEPIVLMGAGGVLGGREIVSEYDQPGSFTEKVILQNIGEDVNRVKVLLEGDIADIVEQVSVEKQGKRQNISVGADESVSLSPQTQAMFAFTFAPEDSGDYTGDIVFDVSGSDIAPYNITVPVQLSVDCKDTFAVVYCITATDLSASIAETGSYNLSIDVKNMGEETALFTSRVEGSLTTLLTGDAQWDEQVKPGNTTTVDIPYNVDQYDSGRYAGSVILSDHEGSVEFNTSVDVSIQEGELDVWSDKSDLGDFVEGQDITFALTINNTGTVPIESVSVSSTSLDFSEQDTVNLDSFESTTRNYTVTAPSNLRGTATINVKAVDLGAQTSHDFTLRTFKDYTSDIAELQEWVSTKQEEVAAREGEIDEAEFENIKNDLTRMENDLGQAQSKWESGDYDGAEKDYKDAESLKGTVETSISNAGTGGSSDETGGEDTDSEEGGGIGLNDLVLPMAIILVLFAVVGIVLYLSVVPERNRY